MKLNDRKFGKIFAEPNLPKSAEPRTEPKFRSLPSLNDVSDSYTSCVYCAEEQAVSTYGNVFTIQMYSVFHVIHLTKTTAAQNGVAFSYHSARGLYFLAVVFVAAIV